MQKDINAKRIWFITDTHLGVRNNSNEWIELIRDYFFNWFFPLVRENYKPGDVLFHLGDYFDSRQSLNLRVLNLGVDIAEECSSIFKDGVYIIVGNHDIWGKTSNDVNSLKSIKWIPGINILEDPASVQASGRSILMMPWRKDHNEDSAFLESSDPHDILCCHTDIRGLKFNRYTQNEEGADVSDFHKFTNVYSGHIHYSQKHSNINMLGSPYELTRSDMDNPKSITLLDLETMKETVYPNNHSPKFKKLYFNDIIEMTIEELEPVFRNNFVDIMIDPEMSLRAPLSVLTDILNTQRSLNFHPFDPNQATPLSEQIMDVEGKQFNVMDFIKEYVKNMDCDEETKDKMVKSISKLYTVVTAQEQEQRIS
jgi:DNA repair exonuclease SbcCD nuclease subunit